MNRLHAAVFAGFASAILWMGAASTQSFGQQPAAQPAPSAGAAASSGDEDPPAFSQEELEQMLAPLALYPDSLISQILMATTYPLEIVQADRWAKANKDLKGDAAAKALEQQKWDPSVKSLVNFPDVLSMLSDKLEWTQKLGDAFIGQQKQVMDTIQKLRGKAKDAGKLDTTKEQNVTVEQQGSTQIIQIESSSPDVIYVPSYNPTVVYGTWPYPSYPPYPYYPPGYAATAAVSFGLGVACGVAWGYAWGHCNWGGSDIDIDINRNTNFNQNINRDRYRNEYNRSGVGNGKGSWQHNGAHREGVGYRNQASAQKFGGQTARQTAQSREQFRGRAETGRRDLSNSGAGGAARDRATPGAGNTGAARDRATPSRTNTAARPSTGSTRQSTGSRDNAFSGSNRSGTSTRASSSRGHSSMGGGSRGGGGRGGGGGRRR